MDAAVLQTTGLLSLSAHKPQEQGFPSIITGLKAQIFLSKTQNPWAEAAGADGQPVFEEPKFLGIEVTTLKKIVPLLHPIQLLHLKRQQGCACCDCKRKRCGDYTVSQNLSFCLFYVMAELWGSVVISVLFWGFANQLGLTPLLAAVYIGALQNIFSKSARYSLFDPCKEMACLPWDEDTKVRGRQPLMLYGTQQFMILTFGSLANSTPYLGGVLLVIVLTYLVICSQAQLMNEVLGVETMALATLHKTIRLCMVHNILWPLDIAVSPNV